MTTQTAGGYYCGTNCTAGLDVDCDGLPNDSRMYIAREAVTANTGTAQSTTTALTSNSGVKLVHVQDRDGQDGLARGSAGVAA